MTTNVFVLTKFGLDETKVREWFAEGRSAEASPYGLNCLRSPHVEVVWSMSAQESRVSRVVRRLVSKALGFDVVHAFRNRLAIKNADVVYSHTEREGLAVIAATLFAKQKPNIVCNVVWLGTEMVDGGFWRQLFHLPLLKRAKTVTVNSSFNQNALRPHLEAEYVAFGTGMGGATAELKAERDCDLLLSVGNDRWRDWATLDAVARRVTNMNRRLRVASSAAPLSSRAGVVVEPTHNVDELKDLYDSCSVVVLPLLPNSHASGITVILEAVIRGAPVIATDTGGLRDYFTDGEIVFVPLGDVRAICEAIELLSDPMAASNLANAARLRFNNSGYSSEAFAERLGRILAPATIGIEGTNR